MEFFGDLERLFATSLYPLRVPIAIGLVVALVVFIYVARRRGWFAAARRHPARTTAIVVVLLAVGLPIGWYLGSPLFIRTSLNEAAPLVPNAAPSAVSPANPNPTQPPFSPAAQTPAPPELGPARTGEFAGADDFHFGSGTASLIETSPGTWILRFEDFSVRNGPDLYVYLSPKEDGYAKAAVELGPLRATDGSFNYEVPAGTDLNAVKSVLVWCKQFAVLFAVAPLS